MLEALFVIKIFKLLFRLFHVRKRFGKKANVNFKIYDVTDWTKNIFHISIVSNISRSKGNETTKFCQSIEYSMISIFLEKNTQNMVEKLVSKAFIKYQNLAFSGSAI